MMTFLLIFTVLALVNAFPSNYNATNTTSSSVEGLWGASNPAAAAPDSPVV